jgi:hypothetical protein
VNPAAHEILESARSMAGMSFDELWLAYMALGGNCPPLEVRTYLEGGGSSEPEHDRVDYDILAHALNERFFDQGADHPVPYRDEFLEGVG